MLRETNVWAELSPDEQTKCTERERKKLYSQTSRLKTPEELQLHHNHEKFYFDCAVALCTMQNALLVISNLT
jgi:hypothetical protein